MKSNSDEVRFAEFRPKTMKGGNRFLFLALILIISAAHSKRVFQTMQGRINVLALACQST